MCPGQRSSNVGPRLGVGGAALALPLATSVKPGRVPQAQETRGPSVCPIPGGGQGGGSGRQESGSGPWGQAGQGAPDTQAARPGVQGWQGSLPGRQLSRPGRGRAGEGRAGLQSPPGSWVCHPQGAHPAPLPLPKPGPGESGAHGRRPLEARPGLRTSWHPACGASGRSGRWA